MTASGEGSARLVGTDAGQTQRNTLVGPIRTEVLDISTDPRQQYCVGYIDYALRENDLLILEMKGDAATNVNNTSSIRIPVTLKNLKTGLETATYLVGADFGLTASNVAVTTAWTVVGTYTVPVQYAIKIGHKQSVNSVIYATLNYT